MSGIKFEYMALETNAPTAGNEQLNGYGQDGWELVTIYSFEGSWYYVFKRMKTQAS